MSSRTAAMIARLAIGGLGAVVLPASPLLAQTDAHPPGWSAASHGDRAAPDYERLFATDRVHELHIAIAREDYLAMQDDLERIGPMGAVRVQGGPVPPAPGPATDARQVEAIIARVRERASAVVAAADGSQQQVAGFAPVFSLRDPIYVPVTVTQDGRTWTGVGMRYKGNSSLSFARRSAAMKLPFRLDFDRYEDDVPAAHNQRFFGFEKLTFSSNYSDDSMLREVLATEIFRDQGVPAARAAFYRVFVDTGDGEEYWGLYTMIEDPADGAMLDAQFGDASGNLYKPEGPRANWTAFEAASFEKKTHKKAADFSDVEAAVAALRADGTDAAGWRAGLESRFDVDGFLRWLAVNTVIANWDAYGRMAHNYYLYGDPRDDGRLHWIPWDHNMSFAMTGRGARPGIPGNGMSDDVLHRGVADSWPLISRLLADEVYAARYRELLAESLDGLLEPAAFAARAAELHALIAPYVNESETELALQRSPIVPRPSSLPATAPPGTTTAFDTSVDLLVTLVRTRTELVRATLAGAQSAAAGAR